MAQVAIAGVQVITVSGARVAIGDVQVIISPPTPPAGTVRRIFAVVQSGVALPVTFQGVAVGGVVIPVDFLGVEASGAPVDPNQSITA